AFDRGSRNSSATGVRHPGSDIGAAGIVLAEGWATDSWDRHAEIRLWHSVICGDVRDVAERFRLQLPSSKDGRLKPGDHLPQGEQPGSRCLRERCEVLQRSARSE